MTSSDLKTLRLLIEEYETSEYIAERVALMERIKNIVG